MEQSKKDYLESNGWKVTTVDDFLDFLGSTPEDEKTANVTAKTFIDNNTGLVADRVEISDIMPEWYFPFYWCYVCADNVPNSRRLLSMYNGGNLLFTSAICEMHKDELLECAKENGIKCSIDFCGMKLSY